MDDSTNNDPGNDVTGRFVVLRRHNDVRSKIGVVSWKLDGAVCNFNFNAERNDEVEEIQKVMHTFRADPSQKTGQPPSFEEFRALFEQHGLEIEEIPEGDMQITFEFDQITGNVVGQSKPMHAFATADEKIPQLVLESIRRAVRQPIIEVVEKLSTTKNCDEAVAVLQQAKDEGKFGFAPTREFLEALLKVDPQSATHPENRKFLRHARLEAAQRLHDNETLAAEAEALLAESADNFTPEEKADLEGAWAIGLAMKGHSEAALATWRGMLKRPEPLSPMRRAWIWRNISRTLSPFDQEKLEATRQSADAFLEAGDKNEASKSLMAEVDILLRKDPNEAIARLEEIISLADREGMRSQQFHAGAFHARGRRLFDLRQYGPALEDAEKAISRWRGLLGAESSLVSSLHLAALILTADGKTTEAKRFSDEAEEHTKRLGLTHFELGTEVYSLLRNYDAARAKEIEKAVRASRNIDLLSCFLVARAMHDPELSLNERLRLLEETLADLQRQDAPTTTQRPVRQAIATLLSKDEQFDRAASWWKQLVDETPFDDPCLSNLLHCYDKLKRWDDAADVLRSQIALRGEAPNILFILGRVLHSAGKMNEAVTTLQKSLQVAPEGSDTRRLALELREKVLEAGGVPLPREEPPSPRKVSRSDFEIALKAFSEHISSDQRMQFWRKKDGRRVWTAKPERFAQNQLHTFLKGRFGDDSTVFEEIGSGAGRLDLYVQLSGGLNIILELKMCGGSYTARYAAGGKNQILHYLEHKKTKLGYLVVFDARSRGHGKNLISARSTGNFTVRETLVDVRPAVPSKMTKPLAKAKRRPPAQ